MSEPGEIYQKMLDVQRSIGAIGKSQTNQHHRYNFRGIDDVLNALHPLLNEAGVFVTPEVLDSEVVAFEARNKTAYRASLRMAYHFWAADGSSVTTTVKGGSIDYDDKAEQQALSQAYKAAMIQTFAIPTQGTPDADSRSPLSEADAQPSRQQPQRPAPPQNGNGGHPAGHLADHQLQARVEAEKLRGDHRELFKKWWGDQQWPWGPTGPEWSSLSESQAATAVAKVVELEAAQAKQQELVP